MLFGTLIQHQLVQSLTLGVALRYVLEALRRPPGNGNTGKWFRFGMVALQEFKSRLHEWPQYCSHIVQIPHLRQNHPELVAEIEREMATAAGMGANRTEQQLSDQQQQQQPQAPTSFLGTGGTTTAVNRPQGFQGLPDPNRAPGGLLGGVNIGQQQYPADPNLLMGGLTRQEPQQQGDLTVSAIRSPIQGTLQQPPGALSLDRRGLIQPQLPKGLQQQAPTQAAPTGAQILTALNQGRLPSTTLGTGQSQAQAALMSALGMGSRPQQGGGGGSMLSPGLDGASALGTSLVDMALGSDTDGSLSKMLGTSPTLGGLDVPLTGEGYEDTSGGGGGTVIGGGLGQLRSPDLMAQQSPPQPPLPATTQLLASAQNLLTKEPDGLQVGSRKDDFGFSRIVILEKADLFQCLISEQQQLNLASCIDKLMPAVAEGLPVTNPPDGVIDRIYFVINNVAANNIDTKAAELREVLKEDYYPWLANYLVQKRISSHANLHTMYMSFIDKLEAPGLTKSVLLHVLQYVSKLLRSMKIITNTGDRSVLKNLGSFLGQMTLARSKPLLQRQLDLKELLYHGYETGRLFAVTPFVAKILECAAASKVFRPPNPWTMGLMAVMAELYQVRCGIAFVS